MLKHTPLNKTLKNQMKNSNITEYRYCYASNSKTQKENTYTADDLRKMFPRKPRQNSASKTVYILDNIVVKRMALNPVSEEMFCEYSHTNQLADEVNTFELISKYDDEEILAQIFRYNKQQGKIDNNDPRQIDKIIVLQEKAYFIGNLRECCTQAEIDGGQNADERYKHICKIADKYGIGDYKYNGGNCGIVNRNGVPTAVIIDYGVSNSQTAKDKKK